VGNVNMCSGVEVLRMLTHKIIEFINLKKAKIEDVP
jgi:hypothetical protein